MPGFTGAVERIWAGERNRQTLSAGLGGKAKGYIESLLGHIGSGRDAAAWTRTRASGRPANHREVAQGANHEHAADADAVHALVAFTGKSEAQVRLCLQAASGDREAAAAMLLES